MIKRSYLILLLIATLIFTSCWTTNDDEIVSEPFQSNYEAIIIDREVFENSIELLAPQSAETSGKIYVKDQFLLINEPNKGFHIYNNSNPSNPIKIKFLKVLGSSDISIKDQILMRHYEVKLVLLLINLCKANQI